MRLQERVPLAPLTTLGVGGEARFFIAAESIDEVREALAFAHSRALPLFVLGGGSNIVVSDEGFDGLVLAPRISGIVCDVQGNRAIINAGAGVAWDDLVAYSVGRGFIGIECLSGIPGTVGGAVVANNGAYGAECSDTFVSADVLVRDSSHAGVGEAGGENEVVRVFKNEECNFSYHDSIFCREPGRYIVLRATFSLLTSGTSRLSYRDNRFNLETLAAEKGREPTPGDVRSAVLKMRGGKGALSSSYKSAGSFFHMPFVSPAAQARIGAQARALDAAKEERLRPWAWEQPDGTYKIAPGFLLEYTEFQRGYARGAVGISPKHTLSIINLGGARARDIAQLARDMQDAVEKIFNIRLEREVEYVGNVY